MLLSILRLQTKNSSPAASQVPAVRGLCFKRRLQIRLSGFLRFRRLKAPLRKAGLIIIMIQTGPQFFLHFARFAHNLPIDVNITIRNLNSFPGQPNQPFNIIFLRIRRILKNHYIPPLRFRKLIDAFIDKNPIAVGQHPHRRHRLFIPAVRTQGLSRPARVRSIIIRNPAAKTAQMPMSAFECFSHAAGWNLKGLNRKRPKHQRQNQCHQQTIQCIHR